MATSTIRSNRRKINYRIDEGRLSIDENFINFDYSRYYFEKSVGSGANGIVFQVRDSFLDRSVAIKIWLIRPGHPHPMDKKFKAEIQKIAPLESPRIVRVYDGGIIDKIYCYGIFEYVDGVSLKQWLSKEKPFHRRKKISDNIFHEIFECHKKGIFHGDLHSQNILITKKDKVKLIDFGTSIFSSSEDSDKREIEKLLETAYEIFPEAKRMRLVDKRALLQVPPHCTPLILFQLPRMIDALEKKPELNIHPGLSEYHLMERYFSVLANQSVNAPFFNIEGVFNFLRENYSDMWFAEFLDKFAAAMIRDGGPAISDLKFLSHMSIAPKDISFFKKAYQQFREGYIERIKREYPRPPSQAT
jgi:serine/threonine protein kinase